MNLICIETAQLPNCPTTGLHLPDEELAEEPDLICIIIQVGDTIARVRRGELTMRSTSRGMGWVRE